MNSSDTAPWLQYCADVLGVKTLPLIPTVVAAGANPGQVKRGVLFLVPSELSTAAQELLAKIVQTSPAQPIELMRYSIHGSAATLCASFAQIGQKSVLVFGDQLFSMVNSSSTPFFDHFLSPVEIAGKNVFAAHDLEELTSSGGHVTTLKKQLWQQLKGLAVL